MFRDSKPGKALSTMPGVPAANGGGHSVRLTIPAKPEYITLGRLALTGIARMREFDQETLGDLKLALTEACTNSVRHAYDAGGGLVEILYELHGDRLVVEVADEGAGFAPDADERFEDDDLSEGGLGIAIIKTLADEFEVVTGDNGSRLRFVKFLD
jgi:serine/threonine-protein kinase RsbW